MKQTTILRLLAVILISIAFSFCVRSAQAQNACCITLPTNNTVISTIIAYPGGSQSASSTFSVTITNGITGVPAGIYAAWCIDANTELNPDTLPAWPGTLISTCDPIGLNFVPDHSLASSNPPVGPTPAVVLQSVWNQINYILNNRAGYFYWDVQTAINSLVGGPPLTNNPAYGVIPQNPAAVAALLNAASTNQDYQPQCGGKIGIIYALYDAVYPPDLTTAHQVQLLIMEVPCCNLVFTKIPADKDLGCNPITIPECDSSVTNVVATSCCGPVTITCSYVDTGFCQKTRTVTYTATDAAGNTKSVSQSIHWIADTNAPNFVTIPTGGDLGCNPIEGCAQGNIPTDNCIKAAVVVSDGCGSPIVSVTHVDCNSNCVSSRTFTITAADNCGNKSAAQTVVYSWKTDTTLPVVTSTPTNSYLGCSPANLPTDASIAALIKASDNCNLVVTNVTHVDATNGCIASRTFTITVGDGCGNVSATKTVTYTWNANKVGPTIVCPPDYILTNGLSYYCTYTPSDYGAPCNGTNASSILTNCFKKLYTNGYAQCGFTNSNYYCKFTTATNACKYLWASGNPGCLKNNYNNPTNCEAGSFGANVLCLKFNVDLGDCKTNSGFQAGCGDLILNDPTCPLNGKSIRQILGICHTALGGGNVSNYGCNVTNLNLICSNLNQSFKGCIPSDWCKTHITPPSITNVPPSISGYPVATSACGDTNVTLTYSDAITAGACTGTYSITRTWVATDACGNTNYCTQNISLGNTKASVCGYVFQDCGGDGFLTPGLDPGIPNIAVTLKNASGGVVGTATTDGQGSYCFYNLAPGTYSVSIVQPNNCVQIAGTHTNHWLDSSYNDCWNENDGYQHWKGGDGVDCWFAKDGYKHWKNSSGQDCWSDKYSYQHTQSCNYVSCNIPKNNVETFTLVACDSKTGVNFAYLGVGGKTSVCVTGPSYGTCGQTLTYTCTVTNTGNTCFTNCQVTACGNTYTCPPLGPGQGCSFNFNYTCQWSDIGTFPCQANANCKYPSSSNPCTAQSTCYTKVSYWGWW